MDVIFTTLPVVCLANVSGNLLLKNEKILDVFSWHNRMTVDFYFYFIASTTNENKR